MSLASAGRSVSDGFEAATKAAIWGGTTTIVEHPGFVSEGSSLSLAVDDTLKKGTGTSYTDFGVHMVFQGKNGFEEKDVRELVLRGHATGKVYTTYNARMNEDQIVSLMKLMERSGGLLLYHAENDKEIWRITSYYEKKRMTGTKYWPLSRPGHCEADAVDLILELAKSTGVPTYIVHLSTLSGLKSIMEIREHGQKIYAETCPQYLCLHLDGAFTSVKMALIMLWRPLRKKKDCEALWKVTYPVISTRSGRTTVLSAGRTKSGTAKETCSGRPGGSPGIETRMPILFSGGGHEGAHHA